MPLEIALEFLRAADTRRGVASVTIVFGPHGFLREFVVAAVADRLSAEGYQYRSFQIGAGGDFGAVLDELGASDLFAAKRLIVCRVLKSHRDRGGDDLPEEESAPQRGPSAGSENALADAIEAQRGPNHLLIVYERDNVPARIRKVAEKTCAMVGCARPYDNQLAGYVQQFARARGLKLAPGAAESLIEKHAGDLASIANTLAKAAILADPSKLLAPEDFDEPGSHRMPEVFEIADSLARGRTAMTLAQIDRALALGRDPIEILAVEVIPVMRRMMVAAAMLARRRSPGEIAAALGASPMSGLVTRAIDGARRFGLERLRRSYTRTSELDEAFKNGTIKEREQALGALLLDLMTEKQTLSA
ncbi:MAG: DNA polymerase III subunit delta [Candidatus Binataceae bacterium]